MYEQQQRKLLTPQQLSTMLKNCEYISHIVFPSQCQKLSEESSCKSLVRMYKQDIGQQGGQMQNENESILKKVEQFHLILDTRMKQFQTICVELFYFLFACMQQQLCVVFHEEFLVYRGSISRFMVVIKELSIFNESDLQIQKQKGKRFYTLFTMVVNDIKNILEHHLQFIKKFITQFNMDKDLKLQKIKKFKTQQPNFKQQDVNNMLRFIRELLSDAYSVRDQCQSDLMCFVELQKCQFMKKSSFLYQINNSSINILLFRTVVEKEKQKFILSVQNENKLVKRYKQLKASGKGSQQQLFDLYRKIVFSFYKYIQQNWKTNPLYKMLSQQGSELQMFLDEKQKNQSKSDSKLVFKTIVKCTKKQFQYSSIKRPKQPQQMLQFFIEYNITKCIITIRLYTPIQLEHHNTDVVVHNWNSLAFSSQCVSLELCERSQVINKKKKFLVLKSVNNYKIGDNFIFQFFRLMDIVMVGYKIMQGQLKSQKQSIFSSYKTNQLDEVHKKIAHYTQLICDVNRRLFNTIKN